MIVVAGTGADGGGAALRSAAQWALLLGRRVAIADCCAGAGGAESPPRTADAEPGLRRARLSCPPDRLAAMRADVVAAVLDRLRRHERSSDLLLFRVPLRERVALMRAVFLGRGLVLPLDDSESGLRDAVDLALDVVRSFSDVALWPYSDSARVLARFGDEQRAIDGERVVPFDPGRLDLERALDGLPGPPDEGFVAATLLPAPADVPAELLRFDSLELA